MFDLGGGTFDVALISIKDGIFEVKATGGNNHLGGQDFTNCITQYCIQRFKELHDIDIMKHEKKERCLCRLNLEAEKAKI